MSDAGIVKCHVPKRVVCPACGRRQPFKKKRGHVSDSNKAVKGPGNIRKMLE